MTSNIDGRRARGDRSRLAVLISATRLATIEGLNGVSIARLAKETNSSKSGVATLFGTKENLQLAAVAEARRVFTEKVIAPTLEYPPGIMRLSALVSAWIDYSEQRVFPGGCFFLATSAEFAAHPGAVRDAIVAVRDEWHRTLTTQAQQAIDDGALPRLHDAEQLAFEIDALLAHANRESLLRSDATAGAPHRPQDALTPYRRAQTAIVARMRHFGASD